MNYYFDSARHGVPMPVRPIVEPIEDYESSMGKDPQAYLRGVIKDAKRLNRDLWVVITEPELWEKDPGKRSDTFLRENFRHVRRLPNWVGPKDMVILIYHLQ